jgi:hypothetical protein
MGLKVVALAAPNTDPYLRLGGLPHVRVVEADKWLDFVRSPDISTMDVLYIDEFARGTKEFHQQAFEILNEVHGHGRQLMGIPVPNLLSVITTDNPAETEDGSVTYDVATLEHAIETRFHIHMWMDGAPCADWLGAKLQSLKDTWVSRGLEVETKKTPAFVAKCLVSWWLDVLDDQGKQLISPRVLEYIGRQVILGDAPDVAIPFGVRVPLDLLREKLNEAVIIDMPMLMSDMDQVKAICNEDPSAVHMVATLLERATVEELKKVRDAIVLLPADMRYPLFDDTPCGDQSEFESPAFADRLLMSFSDTDDYVSAFFNFMDWANVTASDLPSYIVPQEEEESNE